MTEDMLHDLHGAYAGVPRAVNVGHRYANAPIIEAGLTISTTAADGRTEDAPTPAELETMAMVLRKTGFAESEAIYGMSSLSEWRSDKRMQGRHQLGYSALDESGDFGLHVLLDSFGFSWLTQYAEWDAFTEKAEQCWAVYRGVMQPVSVGQVSVRFVNSIELPRHPIEITDYLRTSFQVSPNLPQVVDRFFTQIRVPLQVENEPVIPATITVTTSGDGALILDIEVSLELGIDTRDAHFSDKLDAALTKLRHAKNFVFEACITDATRKLIS
ncbi:MAG: hypothetical protein CME34_18785 [Gordonia sp.]|uniref:TIGR04255 family protein n=1 Tax=Gordonia sp. (in: high G+C Gram-positive bacteria) TaxID=84139 RepID=UPI000C5700C1|nr:TIGR04255 family protein [Gordonia sp. (in: high G+C Gram-positive bacteria)]MAU83873.1 hypothetical protein [Gordonia sp. (in: high G+C Gram-positive bacteria)]